jgi:hypothetical protein
MKRLIMLSLLLAAAASQAQPPQLTPTQRAHVAALGQALAVCHRQGVARYARTRTSVAQITDRVLADCAGREAPIRAEAVRLYGAANAARLLAAQRAHYREMIGRMIARVRPGR